MRAQSGFTLIELILVVVLIGIISAVVLPRLSLSGQLEQRLHADKLVGLLRMAQLRAMNDPSALQPRNATDDLIKHCAKVAITHQGFSLAKDCNQPQLLTAQQLKQGQQQGLYLGTSTVTTNQTRPIVIQFGEVSASENSELLTTDSWLGRPYMNNERLTAELDIIIAGKTVRITPEGYIYGP